MCTSPLIDEGRRAISPIWHRNCPWLKRSACMTATSARMISSEWGAKCGTAPDDVAAVTQVRNYTAGAPAATSDPPDGV